MKHRTHKRDEGTSLAAGISLLSVQEMHIGMALGSFRTVQEAKRGTIFLITNVVISELVAKGHGPSASHFMSFQCLTSNDFEN